MSTPWTIDSFKNWVSIEKRVSTTTKVVEYGENVSNYITGIVHE
jgi:hypothetical protein